MTTHTYLYCQDPGHGWLQVPVEHVTMLGISEDISMFSYTNGLYAYLEEDCDMTTFFQAYRERFGDYPKFEEKHTNAEHPIRSMEPWRG